MRYATRSCAAGGCAWRNIRSKGVHVSAEHNLHTGELLRGLVRLPNVTTLTLEYKSVDFLNDEFLTALPSACPQLSRLRLDEPRYTGVPHFRITPTCLGRFFLRASRLEQLTLDQSLGNMTKLPSSLASLSSLRVLTLSVPRLTVLPDEFSALHALEELRVICPELRSLPASVTQLTRLSRLCLTDCRVMHRLPAQLCAMSVLTALKIHGWFRLEGIPESIGALKELRRLVLRNISCAQPDVGEEWRKLEELRLENVSRGWGRFPPISLDSLALLTIRHCRSLRALPDDIGAAPALREVEIVDTPIAELPTSIATLTSLERLVLAPSKSMRGLPPTLLALPRVAHVMVKNVSALASLIRGGAREEADGRRQPVVRLALVQSFSLECCYFFTHLSPALPALAPSLRALTLADLPALYSLPAEVFRLTALTSLSLLLLRHVNCLPPALSALSALRALRITSASELAALLESLGQLAALESLELDDCPALRSLPASLGQQAALGAAESAAVPAATSGLSELTHLSITRSGALTALPDSVGQLGRLKTLTIASATSAAFLPSNTLSGLTRLEALRISDCPLLAALPASLCTLPRLHTLSLAKCPALRTLPDAIGQLPALKRLSLKDRSALARLPASLPRLPALESLDIASCALHLPDDFRPLPRLARLSVRNCRAFSRLPASLSRLPALRVLKLSSCSSLSVLPPDLAALPALHSLLLDGCSALAELPAGLARARGLRHVDVRGCGAVWEDAEVGVCGRRVHVERGRREGDLNVTWTMARDSQVQRARRGGEEGEGGETEGGEAVEGGQGGAERVGAARGGLEGAVAASRRDREGVREEEGEGVEEVLWGRTIRLGKRSGERLGERLGRGWGEAGGEVKW
ncbi:unnamed protein product [Closterium sp. Naga37s-1]|nr:unnamed protein product [Closterium sp. Naga37s-1]